MKTTSVTQARRDLYSLIDGLQSDHEPVLITTKRANAVLVSEDDWNAVQETLFLVSIPGMREAILTAMATPAEEMSEQLEW